MMALLAGCGNVFRSSAGGAGLMRVRHCSTAAAASARSHDEGRLAHRGPPPLAGRMHEGRAPEVSEVRRPSLAGSECCAHTEGGVVGWEPRPLEARVIPVTGPRPGGSVSEGGPSATQN